MRICVLTVNHGTSAYAELLLESLLHHHPGRDNLTIVVLDNQSDELDRLDRFRSAGVEIRQSGYSTTAGLTTHGEILRDAILAAGEEFDAYLLVDCDVCFVADGTIDELARELDADQGGKWWDTLGLLTQVMKTHGLTFRRSGQGVIHFGNVSWDPQWATEKAAARDALLAKYTTV